MRRIAVINQKGGVGKTTSTVNVGVALARAGHRVLLIDLDPQAHLSLHLGLDPAAKRPGSYELLTGSESIAKARVKAGNNLWVVGSSIDLAGAEVELISVVGREVILRDLLDQHTSPGNTQYDYVLMDCPPSLSVLTLNGLCAAQEVFIPLQPHYLALQGLGKLLETVSLVGKRINPGLKVGGVIVCMHDAGTKLAAEVIDDVRGFFDADRGKDVPWGNARVFDTVIRRNIKLAEAPSYGKSIFDYAPDSNGAKDYEVLAAEIDGRLAAAQAQLAPADAGGNGNGHGTAAVVGSAPAAASGTSDSGQPTPPGAPAPVTDRLAGVSFQPARRSRPRVRKDVAAAAIPAPPGIVIDADLPEDLRTVESPPLRKAAGSTKPAPDAAPLAPPPPGLPDSITQRA